jgi:hypothetical protein
MAEGDLHDEILRLEAEIEQLTEAIERCRNVILVSKVAIAAEEYGCWPSRSEQLGLFRWL